ncbi:MAG: S8 family serine peptidase [Candidatus Devosia phytovorans]|uniref:S8 family serine peptidase n=1 Tax=Candidatus Devosia phytovorans TaxID=3121372 RepID=A0AAJ6B232_9HYPH|nr:S8 family serine peptidase [Devosia sp.]WEK05964.1 MAG: S8 family serine peptidase [Devosia sp.]
MLPLSSISLRSALLALGLVVLPPLVLAPYLAMPVMAQEDDDDDDDGGDDDDDDGDGGSWGGSDDDDDDSDDDAVWTGGYILRPRAQAPAPVVIPRPDQADDQIVVQRLSADDRATLLGQGYLLLAESRDRLLLQLPDHLNVDEALSLLRETAPAALAAPNSYYRSQAVPMECEGALCAHWEAVNWPPVTADPLCRFEPHIGVIDTGVNQDHAMLTNARLSLETIGSAGAEPSEHKHGTAVVAMFVGAAGDRVPGLAPAAQLLVVDPFGMVDGDERSDVFSLVSALDRLVEAKVDVASLSLAGPDNPLLAEAVARLQTAGIPIVAAVGNAGPRAAPLYPAAYPEVVAVTAVDISDNIYRRAIHGDHVLLAAPGVEIATAASISGVRPQTGTSFAVPFVTTAVAAAMAGDVPVDEAIDALIQTSRDLGEAGRDPVFGWGMVQIPSPC